MNASLNPLSGRSWRLTMVALGTLMAPLVLAAPAAVAQDFTTQGGPPLGGTLFEVPDMINESDPSSLSATDYVGRGERSMYDRRVETFVNSNAFVYNLSFDDGLGMEVRVNPEFGSQEAARAEVDRHSTAIGQMPATLREAVETVTIQGGDATYGGGKDLLIHSGSTSMYESSGTLEEVMIHEAAHALDAEYASAGWASARDSDPTPLSDYARDNPDREDVAETFVVYLADRYRSDRISEKVKSAADQVPARMAFLDNQGINAYPMTGSGGGGQAQPDNAAPDNAAPEVETPQGDEAQDLDTGQEAIPQESTPQGDGGQDLGAEQELTPQETRTYGEYYRDYYPNYYQDYYPQWGYLNAR